MTSRYVARRPLQAFILRFDSGRSDLYGGGLQWLARPTGC